MHTKLYNLFFPVWLLLFIPPIIFVVLPINLLIDSIVIIFTLKYLNVTNYWNKTKSVIIKIWLCGFIADIIGALLMFSAILIDDYVFHNGLNWWYEHVLAINYNPFANIFAFLWTTLCLLITSIFIFLFNYYFCLKKIQIDNIQRRKLSISSSIFTTPYIFYLPTTIFYDLLSILLG